MASVEGYNNEGVVTFEKIVLDVTRVKVEFEYEPEGLVEKTVSAIGADDLQVEQDLARFKALVEQTGGAAEGWRGEVREGRPESAPSENQPAGEGRWPQKVAVRRPAAPRAFRPSPANSPGGPLGEMLTRVDHDLGERRGRPGFHRRAACNGG